MVFAGSAPAVSGLVFASVFDWIADLARSDWVYLIVPALIVVDAFVGILPAETALHAAGVGAAQGDERGWLLTVSRFVPGLRTVTMLAAGATGMACSRFLSFEVPGAALWASYNVVLGYVLGQIFKDSGLWVPLLISAAIAGGLTVAFELVRRAKSHAEPAGAS